jgi:hypothetical protein
LTLLVLVVWVLALHGLLLGAWQPWASSPDEPRPAAGVLSSALADAAPDAPPVQALAAAAHPLAGPPLLRLTLGTVHNPPAEVADRPAVAVPPARAVREAKVPTTQASQTQALPPLPQTPALHEALPDPPPEHPPEPSPAPIPLPPTDTLLAQLSDAAPRSTARAAVPAVSNLPPAAVPDSVRLDYEVDGVVKGFSYRARSGLDWTNAAGRYSARLEIRLPLLGSRVQTSTGRVLPTGLLPERFADKTRSEKAAHFDAERQTIRFSNNQPDVPLQAGAQDRLSLFMQLAGLLQAQPQGVATGQVISMQVAGTSDAEIWRFQVQATESLVLPAGALRARKLVREPREPHDHQVEIWLAPAHAHLPVRIRITQSNGDRVDQLLARLP